MAIIYIVLPNGASSSCRSIAAHDLALGGGSGGEELRSSQVDDELRGDTETRSGEVAAGGCYGGLRGNKRAVGIGSGRLESPPSSLLKGT